MFSGVQTPNDVSSGLFTTATTKDGQMNTIGSAITATNISAGVEEKDNNDGGIDALLVSPYDAETIAFFAQIERIVFGASKDHDLIPSNGMTYMSSSNVLYDMSTNTL